jgi:hypothetical protein
MLGKSVPAPLVLGSFIILDWICLSEQIEKKNPLIKSHRCSQEKAE